MMGPPGPPMGMGPMGHPGMQQGPMGFPPQGSFQQPGFPMMGGEQMTGESAAEATNSANPGVIEAKPRVIYSAPPVRTVPKKPKKGKSVSKRGAQEDAASAGTVSGDSASTAAASTGDGESLVAPIGHDDPAPVDMELDTEVSAPTRKEKKEKKKKFIRTAAGTVWEDPTLAEWDPGMSMGLVLCAGCSCWCRWDSGPYCLLNRTFCARSAVVKGHLPLMYVVIAHLTESCYNGYLCVHAQVNTHT